MGVTTKKKMIAITIGDTKFPKKIPNLNQILFKGVNNFEFKKPRIKNKIAIINDQVLNSSFFKIGQKAINANRALNTNPKLLLELILISL